MAHESGAHRILATHQLSSRPRVPALRRALRRVSYYDADTNKRLKFLTHNFTLPAPTIAQIYKQRWQVELFFKWIQQHLRIKPSTAPARTR
jgi:IS4 transposase